MIGFLKRLLRPQALPRELSYEEARAVLEAHERKSEEELAARTDAEPEMLYYLAERGSTAARKAVAANPATPAEANRLLVEDVDLLRVARVAEPDPKEEPVELRLREREGPLVLDRVLGGDHEEGIRHPVGDAIDGRLSLLHAFEER